MILSPQLWCSDFDMEIEEWNKFIKTLERKKEELLVQKLIGVRGE
tara:strand:- start:1952 stop:2086 length:135 start_codon:yes stop_codon:yes gene_type:complete